MARHAINVEELATHTASAPMSAEILFHQRQAHRRSDLGNARALFSDLEQISNGLMVDITLDGPSTS